MKIIGWYILVILSTLAAGAILLSIADYLLLALDITEFPAAKVFQRIYVYFMFALTAYLVYGIALLLILLELFHRFNRYRFLFLMVGSLLIFSACIFIFWEEPRTAADTPINILQIKNSACLVLTGLAYPFISEFWRQRFNLFME